MHRLPIPDGNRNRKIALWRSEIFSSGLFSDYLAYGPPSSEIVPRAAPLTSVSVGETLEHAIGIAPAYWTQKDQNRVSACLEKLG